jgi:hypothetical protein
VLMCGSWCVLCRCSQRSAPPPLRLLQAVRWQAVEAQRSLAASLHKLPPDRLLRHCHSLVRCSISCRRERKHCRHRGRTSITLSLRKRLNSLLCLLSPGRACSARNQLLYEWAARCLLAVWAFAE